MMLDTIRYLFRTITIVATLLSFTNGAAASTEKEILARAITIYNGLGPNVGLKEKLDKLEEVVDLVQKIRTDHGGTDVGLKLLSGQRIGAFDPSKVSAEYLETLTSYQDTVCETEPSFDCLATTSLKIGVDACSSDDVVQLRRGSFAILNAIRVFDVKSSKFRKYAVNEYFDCVRSIEKSLSKFDADAAIFELVKYNLEIEKISVAKAHIQKLTLPVFKVYAILALKEQEEKSVDHKFIRRLEKYISDKKLKGLDKFLAELELKNFMLKPIYKGNDRNSSRFNDSVRIGTLPKLDINRYGGVCDDVKFRQLYYDQAYFIFSRLKDYTRSMRTSPYAKHVAIDNNTLQAKRAMAEFYKGCNIAQTFGLALELGGILMDRKSFDNSRKLDQFLGNVLRFPADLFEKFVALEIKNVDDVLFRAVEKEDAETKAAELRETIETINCEKFDEASPEQMKCLLERAKLDLQQMDTESKAVRMTQSAASVGALDKETGAVDIDALAQQLPDRTRGSFIVFKKYIEFGKMCEGTEILFARLKKTDYFSAAVTYSLTNGDFDPNRKYECGDSELEVLLK